MKSSEAAMGGGEVGAQRPVLRSNELKKTGARSARARTRGQNPLVINILLNFSWWCLQRKNGRVPTGCHHRPVALRHRGLQSYQASQELFP